jgi:RNA-directed DNA polymerase
VKKAMTGPRRVGGGGMIQKALRVNQGDLRGKGTGVHVLNHRRASRAGVRAPIVAEKRRNGRGAKGAQEGGLVEDIQQANKPAAVSKETKQAGETNGKWTWVEASVWSPPMLAALEAGVKGGVWFSLIDKLYAMPVLRAAFAKVKANAGAAGIDHQTIEMYERELEANLQQLAARLKDGSYQPQAVRRVWIDKPGSKEKRGLGIPTVGDRIVQTAMRSVIEPIFERDFAEQSYGFRPRRGCQEALKRVEELLDEGYIWVVDADLKNYFDTIRHEEMMKLIAEKIADGRVLKLVSAMLKQGVIKEMEETEPEAGTPQGSAISPLMSNIYLDRLDHKMEREGREMVRYADDFVILCRSEQEAKQALEEVREWTAKAGLQLHPEKTRIVDAREKGGFDFLGYHYERGYKWPRRKSQQKIKDAIRSITKRTSGQSLEAIITQINRKMRGWYEYFKHSHPTTFRNLDGWIRMRMRSILRYRAGRKGRGRGADHQRWPNKYFEAQGFHSLDKANALRGQPLKR